MILDKSFQYLLEMRKSKGSEIKYTKLEMAHYLLPNEHELTIIDIKLFFSIRNRMNNNSNNFPSKKLNLYCK